jgi:hypothetical protein
LPAKDRCQDEVVRALQKDGWQVNTKPPRLNVMDIYVHIDLEARKPDEHLYIEVKYFPGYNDSQELYISFGQYVIYREILAKVLPNAVLYLAVPKEVYENVFTDTIRSTAFNNRVQMIVVDIESEVIVQWISS